MTSEEYCSRAEKASLGDILKASYRLRRLHLKMPQSLIKNKMNKEAILRRFAQSEDLHIDALTPLGGGVTIPAICHRQLVSRLEWDVWLEKVILFKDL